ncbi:MAG: hypothetical protein IKG42_06300 [Clostridia bacterium]|nr:hypothetical protein [Clostridia bacterium]
MKLVFLIFFILILGVVFSKIKININDLTYSNNEKNIEIKIFIMLFSIIPITLIKLNNDKIKFLRSNTKIKNIIEKFDIKKARNSIKLKDLKNLKIEVPKLKLYLEYSCKNVLATTYITPLICTVINYFYYICIKDFNKEKYSYKVNPMYLKKRYLYIKFESIIEIRMWNIINMIFLIRRKMK